MHPPCDIDEGDNLNFATEGAAAVFLREQPQCRCYLGNRSTYCHAHVLHQLLAATQTARMREALASDDAGLVSPHPPDTQMLDHS